MASANARIKKPSKLKDAFAPVNATEAVKEMEEKVAATSFPGSAPSGSISGGQPAPTPMAAYAPPAALPVNTYDFVGGGLPAGTVPSGGGAPAPVTNTGGDWKASVTDPNERWLWMRESTMNPLADNPTSTAFGIWQGLASTRKAYAARFGFNPNTTNPWEQLQMGRAYVKDRYGTFANAVAFHRRNGWY